MSSVIVYAWKQKYFRIQLKLCMFNIICMLISKNKHLSLKYNPSSKNIQIAYSTTVKGCVPNNPKGDDLQWPTQRHQTGERNEMWVMRG